MRASADPSSVVSEEKAGSKLQLENSPEAQPSTGLPADAPSAALSDLGPETRPVPQTKPGEMKVALEAPLVFSGRARAQTQPAAPVAEAATLPLTRNQIDPLPAVVVLPPASDSKRAGKGFFGHVKGFFGAIFR